MNSSNHTIEKRIQAVRWKLGLSHQFDEVEMATVWANMSHGTTSQVIASYISKLLANGLVEQLDEPVRANSKFRSQNRVLADLFLDYCRQQESVISGEIAKQIRLALENPNTVKTTTANRVSKVPTAPPPAQKPTTTVAPASRQQPTSTNQTNQPKTANQPQQNRTANQPPPTPAVKEQTVPPIVQRDPPPVPNPKPTPAWKYLPVPDHPDKHTEFDARMMPTEPGYKLAGARVRGKKHKHDGTNCDDWFETGRVGDWTIIAVADGAGSKMFSRVGAKVACNKAIEALKASLPAVMLPPEPVNDWNSEGGPGSQFVNGAFSALHDGMQLAAQSLTEATIRCQTPEHQQLLGREVTENDLGCTLLLAIHHVVPDSGDFVMACQVGDGMIAGIEPNGEAMLLGTPDSGEFSGETEFLTSLLKKDANYLRSKTKVIIRPLRALMLMTDGVADDYFPQQDQLPRLWGDLLVNGILDIRTDSLTDDRPDHSDCDDEVELITPDHPRPKLKLRSVERYAEKMKQTVAEAVADSANLLVAAQSAALPVVVMATGTDTPAERLRLWLDAYTVRGSFDDRTLVVLYGEKQ